MDLKAPTKEGVNTMGTASYRDFSGTGAENYRRYFEPAIGIPVSGDLLRTADLKPGERVLDVACGTGVIARQASEQVGPTGSVTGVDLAPDMIDVAKSTSTTNNIEWRVEDATELSLPDDSFDVVLCQMGLMFMGDQLAALGHMRRVLAPGGRLVINTPGRIQPPLELMEQAIVEHISADLGGFVRTVFSMHDPEAVGALVRDAGFSDVTATVSTSQFKLPAPADFLWQYINLTPMGPFVDGASDEAKAAMEEQVVKTWEPFVTNGSTMVDQPMVIVTGRK